MQLFSASPAPSPPPFPAVTRATLLHVLERPTDLGPDDVRELEHLAQAFPYCQTAHLLLAKAAHDQGTMLAGQRLRRAATYAADRTLLRRLIEQAKPRPLPQPASVASRDLVDRESEVMPTANAPVQAVLAPAPVGAAAPSPPAPAAAEAELVILKAEVAPPASAQAPASSAMGPLVEARIVPLAPTPAAAENAVDTEPVAPVAPLAPIEAPAPGLLAEAIEAAATLAIPTLPAPAADTPASPVTAAADTPVAVAAESVPFPAQPFDSGITVTSAGLSEALATLAAPLALVVPAAESAPLAADTPAAATAPAALETQAAPAAEVIPLAEAAPIVEAAPAAVATAAETIASLATPAAIIAVVANGPATEGPSMLAGPAAAPGLVSVTSESVVAAAYETSAAATRTAVALGEAAAAPTNLAVAPASVQNLTSAGGAVADLPTEAPLNPANESDLPAQAPAIRPPAEVGAARFEYGLSVPAPQPAAPSYELPGLVDEWASAAVTLSLGGPELLAAPAATQAPPVFTPAAFTGDATVGYAYGESSRLGLSMQLLDLLTARAEAAEAATAVVAAAQPAATSLPPTGIFFEPDPLLLDHWATHRPAVPELPTSIDLINNFLRRQPRLTRAAMLPPAATHQADLSVRSTRAEPDLVSENLARIFVRQGKTARAIEIYEKLMVKQPEKMAYFAAQIQSLQPTA